MFKVYKCMKCGQVIVKVKATACTPTCCGEPMTELTPNTTDAAQEKHVPVIDKKDGKVVVKVGSVAHPMEADHFISPIMLETSEGVRIRELAPGDAPEAEFSVGADEKVIAAYEYCNKHGLWKADAE